MTGGSSSVAMNYSRDMYHESHHGKLPPFSMPNPNTHNKRNPINRLNYNHNSYVKEGIRSDMGKIQGDKMITRGKKDDLQMG